MAARDYAPQLGTFTQQDSYQGSAANPASMNRFLYAHANPATLIDPDGHMAMPNRLSGAYAWMPRGPGPSIPQIPSGMTADDLIRAFVFVATAGLISPALDSASGERGDLSQGTGLRSKDNGASLMGWERKYGDQPIPWGQDPDLPKAREALERSQQKDLNDSDTPPPWYLAL